MSVILQLQIMVQFCRSYLMDQPRVDNHDCLEKCVFPGKTYCTVQVALFLGLTISAVPFVCCACYKPSGQSGHIFKKEKYRCSYKEGSLFSQQSFNIWGGSPPRMIMQLAYFGDKYLQHLGQPALLQDVSHLLIQTNVACFGVNPAFKQLLIFFSTPSDMEVQTLAAISGYQCLK